MVVKVVPVGFWDYWRAIIVLQVVLLGVTKFLKATEMKFLSSGVKCSLAFIETFKNSYMSSKRSPYSATLAMNILESISIEINSNKLIKI